MRPVPLASLTAAVLFLVASGPVGASDASVQIQSYHYYPHSARVGLGHSVTWTNLQGISHTSTSGGYDGYPGPSLWKSPDIPYQQTYSFTFQAAGTYDYHCSIHSGMFGAVRVRMNVDPRGGGLGTIFTVTWASTAGIPPGFDEDIQIRPPGAGWTNWLGSRTGSQISATFTPDAGTGTYAFRSRLQNEATHGASDWSPPFAIDVT